MTVLESNVADPPAGRPQASGSLLQRYLPLAVWAVAVLALVFIPLKICSYGMVPAGDARRHIAKAFTDKPYAEILVMRPVYSMDHSPGWEWFLGAVHRATGCDADSLAALSLIVTMLSVFLAPLPWLRRPEAWLAALLGLLVAQPGFMVRFTQGRPYLVTEGILIAVMLAWSRNEEKRPSPYKLALTCLGFALSTWVHGAWYLWVLPLAAFFLAGRWRAGLQLSACAAAGIFAGALLTGKPFEFLNQALLILATISREVISPRFLVEEFRPSDGYFRLLLLLGLVFLAWKHQSSPRDTRPLTGPMFWLMVITWVLGFKAARFWVDWGIPLALVWLALRLEEIIDRNWEAASPKRLAACGLLAVPLFLNMGTDQNGLYASVRDEYFVDARDPRLNGWMPERGGIFYTAQLDFFFNTFYRNPNGDWRYILGMEPALMPEDDLKIYRRIQKMNYAFAAYEPWIEKMRPEDRLVVYSSGPPPLPRLEWKNAVGDVWIGRLPRKP